MQTHVTEKGVQQRIFQFFQGLGGLECHPGEGNAQKEIAQPPQLLPPTIPTMGVGPNLNVKPPISVGSCPPPSGPPPQNNNLQQQGQGGPPAPAPPPPPPPPPSVPPSGGNENSDTKSQNHQNSAVNHPKGLVPGRAGGGGYSNNHGSNSSKPNSDNATMPKRPRKTSGGVLGYGIPPKNAQGNMSSIDTVSSLFSRSI